MSQEQNRTDLQRQIGHSENEKLQMLQQINELQSKIQHVQQKGGMDNVRYRELEQVLQEERRTMQHMESTIQEFQRKEDHL